MRDEIVKLTGRKITSVMVAGTPDNYRTIELGVDGCGFVTIFPNFGLVGCNVDLPTATPKKKLVREVEEYIRRLDSSKITVSYKIVFAIKLPTGAVELIINTENIREKLEYYLKAYDDDLKLVSNRQVEIVGYMLL